MRVVGTAGHVDHGKSTLIHALTGIDPDRLQEEKERGMTIDLGFAWLQLPNGAEVSIDGQVVGRAPLEPLSLPLGEHQITLKHSKAGSDRQRVTVKADAPTRIVGKLR